MERNSQNPSEGLQEVQAPILSDLAHMGSTPSAQPQPPSIRQPDRKVSQPSQANEPMQNQLPPAANSRPPWLVLVGSEPEPEPPAAQPLPGTSKAAPVPQVAPPPPARGQLLGRARLSHSQICRLLNLGYNIKVLAGKKGRDELAATPARLREHATNVNSSPSDEPRYETRFFGDPSSCLPGMSALFEFMHIDPQSFIPIGPMIEMHQDLSDLCELIMRGLLPEEWGPSKRFVNAAWDLCVPGWIETGQIIPEKCPEKLLHPQPR